MSRPRIEEKGRWEKAELIVSCSRDGNLRWAAARREKDNAAKAMMAQKAKNAQRTN